MRLHAYRWFGAIFEWLATWLLLGYPTFHFSLSKALDGLRTHGIKGVAEGCSGGNMRHDEIRAIYDGSLFYRILDEEASKGNLHAVRWQEKLQRRERLRQ